MRAGIRLRLVGRSTASFRRLAQRGWRSLAKTDSDTRQPDLNASDISKNRLKINFHVLVSRD